MKVQDVIVNKEKLVKTIYDMESAKCLQDDKNCQLLLTFLLEGPMTFDDIKQAFKDVQAEKSDKTIYGYLNKLKKSDLVMETGKRIITFSESQIKTLTLYAKTAKVFYIAIDIEKAKKEKYFELTSKLLCNFLGYKQVDEDCFRKIYEKYIEKKRLDVSKINDIDNPELIELLSS
ncbi:MAG: hypothetical protein ACFFDW_09405, partial [Candidatus Thorarchaeota archaeon]